MTAVTTKLAKIATGPIVLVGVTHRRVPLELLERVSLDGNAAIALAKRLTGVSGCAEAVVVSTCNRTELYLGGDALHPSAALGLLAHECGVPLAQLHRFADVRSGDAVAEHLFRVAAGLESRVSGEVEVIGQIRTAIASAVDAGTAGPNLTALFRFAVSAGRQARRTTDGALVPSLARLALDAALDTGTPPIGRAVVIGSGAMAASTVRELATRGLGYYVCARRPERAAPLASSPFNVFTLDDLPLLLEISDLVICATRARSPLVLVTDLARAVERRDGRRLTIVDLSLPRNVEPKAAFLPGVRLLDLDALDADIGELQVQRREKIVLDELRRYRSSAAARSVGQQIAQLRARVHAACQQSISGSPKADSMSPEALATARSIANRMLHAPTMAVRRLVEAGDHAAALAVIATFEITPSVLRSERTPEARRAS